MKRRALPLLLAGLLAATLVPTRSAVAQTDPVYRFDGSGWGHGVGMSQYGARSMAVAGMTAQQILEYYYTGVTLKPIDQVLPADHWMRTDPDPLWIGLAQNQTVLRFHVHNGSAGLCKANDGEGTCPTQTANTGENWEFRALGGGACQFFREGVAVGNTGTCRAAIEWGNQPNTQVHLSDLGKEFGRGVIRIRPLGNAFHVSLEIGVDDYIYGIGEVPSSWPSETLKAQAIAARSYGVRQALRYGPEPSFDGARQAQCWCQLYATVIDQNYTGYAKEQGPNAADWVGAVTATAGTIITHPEASQSTVVLAYYSSSSGGHTDNNVDGLGQTTPVSYLQAKPDPYSKDANAQNPFAAWTVEKTASQIAAALGLQTVTGVAVTARHASGSVMEVSISGTIAGVPTTITRSGRSFRSALGMRSITFSVNAPSGAVIPVPTGPLCKEPAPDAGFTDVAAASVHKVDIDCVAFHSVLPGRTATTFEPAGEILRWEMALYLAREATLLGIVLPTPIDQGFLDLGGVAPDAVAAINQLREIGLTKGTGATTFDPNGTINRWQMAIFLTRLHGLAGYDLPVSTPKFNDLTGMSAEAITAINQLVTLGVTNGTSSTTFSPNNQVTREQMASFMARILRIDTK